jgi:hypothetical protein
VRVRRGLSWAVIALACCVAAAGTAAAEDPSGLEAGEWHPGQAPLTTSEGYLRIVKRAEVLAALQQEGRDRREATLARRRAAESGIAARGGDSPADLRRRALARYHQALRRARRKLQRQQDATSQGGRIEREAPSQGDTTTGNTDNTTPTDTGTVEQTPAPQTP